jgi:hypothetical protein
MLFWFGGNLVLGKARKRRRRRLIGGGGTGAGRRWRLSIARGQLGRARVRVDPGVEKVQSGPSVTPGISKVWNHCFVHTYHPNLLPV